MSDPVSKGGVASRSLLETARMVLQCPIFHSHEEGIIMEVVQYLIDAKKDKHALWGHFHSLPWPPSFFTSYPEGDSKSPITGQGIVVFIIDCRSEGHAQSLLNGLRAYLLRLYGSAGHREANFSVFIHKGERQDWSLT
jgi:hypothetical protein